MLRRCDQICITITYYLPCMFTVSGLQVRRHTKTYIHTSKTVVCSDASSKLHNYVHM